MCNGVVVYTSLIHLQKLKRRYIFMDKVKTKIIETDYFKFFKVFIPLSVIFMTAGAAMGELAVPVHSVEAFIFIVAYGGVCLLIMGIYWLAVAAWLYKKGEEAQMHGLLWLVLGLSGNVFAADLFFIVRGFIRQKCPQCGGWQPAKRWFCTRCGAEINRSCPECGDLCGPGDKYCSRCGHSFQNGVNE